MTFGSLISEKSLLVVFVFTSWICEIETLHVFKHLGANFSKDETSRGGEIGILTSTPAAETGPLPSWVVHTGTQPGPGWCFPTPVPALPGEETQGTVLFGGP